MDKQADNANDSSLGIDVLLTPLGLQCGLALDYETLTAAMTKVSKKSEYFRELNNILGALRKELESR